MFVGTVVENPALNVMVTSFLVGQYRLSFSVCGNFGGESGIKCNGNKLLGGSV